MIYRLKQYQEKFYPEKSVRTVSRMVKSGLMQENHRRVNDNGYDILIEVVTFQELSALYLDAAIEFNSVDRSIRNHERAAKIAIKYDISMKQLCKIVGL